MTRPIRPDDDLDDIGPDFNALSTRYEAHSEGIEPPQHLDAQLLAAAHRAAAAKPRVPGQPVFAASSFMRRVRAPFGLAATIVAVASISVALWKQSPEKLAIPSDHAGLVESKKAPAAPQPGVRRDQAVAVTPAPAFAPPAELELASPAPVAIPERKRTQEPLPSLKSPPPAPVPSAPAEQASDPSKLNEAKSPSAASTPKRRESTAPDQTLDRVTVTGSNLRRADTETPSPVQELDRTTGAAPAPVAPAAPAPAQASGQTAPAATSPAPPPPPATDLPAGPAPPLSATAPPLADSVPKSAPSPASAADSPPPAAPAFKLAPPASAAYAVPKATPAPELPPAQAPAPEAVSQAQPPERFATPEVATNSQLPTETRQAALITALQTAADVGDTAAARAVLDALKKNYPHAQISAQLRAELTRLGISLPKVP